MSLSQKHSGKVFVPWYNSAEWREVYKLLCSETERNYPEVLRILKIWKCRTPLLSAGVQGTLILLEALLTEKNNLSNVQLAQIYAISLMRFLNICPANSDRQGNFDKTSIKNELPRWLISIRHDIAHDHKLPSKAMMELGLNCSLNWVKEKYWNIQNQIISDYVVADDSEVQIVKLLSMYVKLKLDLFRNNTAEYDVEEFYSLLSKSERCYQSPVRDIKGIINFTEEILKEKLAHPDYKNFGEKVAKTLINDSALLNTSIGINEEGNEFIPKDFRDMWSNLLNILFENGFLFSLLNELLELTNNIMIDDSFRKAASLWIWEIFQGLRKIRLVKEEIDAIAMANTDELDPRTSTIVLKSVIEQKCPEFKGCLEFDSPHCLSFVAAEIFEKKILNFPNSYTLKFLESVLKFNTNEEEYINDAITLVKNLISSTINILDEEVHTADHLEENIIDDDMECDDSRVEATITDKTPSNDGDQTQVLRKWALIQDTLPYQDCPLGILPHQNRNKNPVLLF